MFEFRYHVNFTIRHPCFDAKNITSQITELSPKTESTAGEERKGKGGKLLGRLVDRTVWSAPLHPENTVDSATCPVSGFIISALAPLKRHKRLFQELNKEGECFLRIAWFSEGKSSAGALSHRAIKACADLGLGIEMYFYSPNRTDKSGCAG